MAHAVETLTMSIARTSIDRREITPLPCSPSSSSSYAATTWREGGMRAPTSIARSLHLARSLASSSSSLTTRWQGRSRLCAPSSLSLSDELMKTTEAVAMPPYSSTTGRERPRSSSVAMAAASYSGPGSMYNAHRLQSVCLSGAVAPSLSLSSAAAVAAKAAKAAADTNSRSAVDDGSGDDDVNPLIVCFGEMLIDFVPTTNGLSLAEAQAFKKAPGGAPANVAVGVARLGGNAAFVGKVGEDEFGHMLVNILEENNVKTQGVRFDEGARTALAFVTLKSNGEREFMFYRNPSADMLLQPEELDKQLLRNASVLHYGSISLISDPSRSAHMAAMELAKEGGAVLSYDPNLRIPLWPSNDAARDGIMSIWNKAQIIKISDDELEFLSEGGDPHDENLVRRFWHDDLQLLLVTRGAGGSSYFTNSASGHVPGVQVSTIDTTGAGDAFVAGLLSQFVVDQSILTDEEKLRSALQFANTCGAITTTERGAIPALPDREAVLKIMSKTMVA